MTLLHPFHVDAAADLLLHHIGAFGVGNDEALGGAYLHLCKIAGQLGQVGLLQGVCLTENGQNFPAGHQTGGLGLACQTLEGIARQTGGGGQHQQHLTVAHAGPEIIKSGAVAVAFVGSLQQPAAGGAHRQGQVLKHRAGEDLPLITAGISQCQAVKGNHRTRSFQITKRPNCGRTKTGTAPTFKV